MSLEILWFVLIAVLWAGFFFLEGFDFGVGILQFFLGKTINERGTYIRSIGPHWDGNEVWLITAGGAMFAAFPPWYASLFSALYLPFVILLLALIVRGVCFEFRHRAKLKKHRNMCDIALMLSSFMCAILTPVAMANLVIGIPIDATGNFTGTLFDLLKPNALFIGVLGLFLFLSDGVLFLALKIEGDLQERACKAAKFLIVASVILYAIMTVVILENSTIYLAPFALVCLSAIFVFTGSFKLAFIFLAFCIGGSVAALFYEMFPNVLVAVNPENSLTVWNSSSSEYTLKVISITTAIFMPIVLAYQIWSYYVFRGRINPKNANVEV
ncbi:MAG: cytochrome d ubiquinol oxidase subunit II [Fibromonadales bacterium]|nr:cytochrome d ubiquinol oxidase subunit II [Fibromonadales bacterium]